MAQSNFRYVQNYPREISDIFKITLGQFQKCSKCERKCPGYFCESERFEVNDLLCQGSTWEPLKTSATIDTIGKDEEESGENTYKYKETVMVPPLSFIDDIAAITKCGVDSVVTNAVIN